MASAWVKGSETIHRSAALRSRDSRPSQPTRRPATARLTTARRLEKSRAIFILSAHQQPIKRCHREKCIVSGHSLPPPSLRNEVSFSSVSPLRSILLARFRCNELPLIAAGALSPYRCLVVALSAPPIHKARRDIALEALKPIVPMQLNNDVFGAS